MSNQERPSSSSNPNFISNPSYSSPSSTSANSSSSPSSSSSSSSSSPSPFFTPTNIPKNFNISSFSSLSCRLHPNVIFTILDAYVRREEGQSNVLGTLLGVVSEGNQVEITDCFVDRHSLTDEGLLQIIKDHHESMYELKHQVNAKEQVVGWFCTDSEMGELTCAVHGWFKQFNSVSKFLPNPPLTEPIHLMIDAAAEKGSLSIKAYVQTPMQLAKEACFKFQEINLDICSSASDRSAISMLLKAREAEKKAYKDSIPQIKDGCDAAITRLIDLVNKCSIYVENVLRETEKPNQEIGRYLSKALCNESMQDCDQLEHFYQNAIQDSLMCTHLTNLSRLQVALAEKLNTSFF